jgi:hypothetical protein
MPWRAALLAASALAFLAPAAFAGTASVDGGTLSFRAAPGEVNSFDARFFEDDQAYRLGDRNAPVTAGAGCTQESSTDALCPAVGITALSIDLGDGDDMGEAAGGPAPITMHGGPGNDVLSGLGTLAGDEGDDYLVAGAGHHEDVFIGGPGHDQIEAYNSDTIDCQGDFDDVIKFSHRPKVVNCPGPPSVAVTVSHVSVKKFLAGKMKIAITCSPACAYRFFLKITPPLRRYMHHAGDNIEARPIALDDSGFLKLATTVKTNAFVSGSSTAHALSHLHRFKLRLVVEAYSGQNVGTTKTIPVQIG